MSYTVITRYESRRRCGYRYAGKRGFGLYLVGGGMQEGCERLPHPLPAAVKFSRSFHWINPQALFFPIDREPACNPLLRHSHDLCPMCNPLKAGTKQGLMWVGDDNYTPDQFTAEALQQGVSKRIGSIAKDFVFGQNLIYLAHIHAWKVVREYEGEPLADYVPGVFYVFRPQRLEIVIDDPDNIPAEAQAIKERFGDQAVFVKVKEG